MQAAPSINPANMLGSTREAHPIMKMHLPVDPIGAAVTACILAVLIPAIFGTWINSRKPKQARPIPKAPAPQPVPWPQTRSREG